MTFKEAEAFAPNGFHDAKIDALHLDYKTGALSLSMRLLCGSPGMADQEDYCRAELRVGRLLFCAIDPPDPRYPFAPDHEPLGVSGADGLGDLAANSDLITRLPSDASLYRFFVEQWNSFIYIAGHDIRLSLNTGDSLQNAPRTP